MKTRVEIKRQAKERFKAQYGAALGLYLLPVLVVFGVYLAIMLAIVMPIASSALRSGAISFDSTTDLSALPSLILFAVMMVCSCLLSVMMVGSLGGYARVYRGLAARASEPFTSLRRNFWRKLGAMLKIALFVMLWSLAAVAVYYGLMLLIASTVRFSREGLQAFMWVMMALLYALMIPAIVKAISYSMTPYILAEYPDVTAGDAIRLSMRLTRGHKGELFVAYLSFFGWSLLGALTFGLLTVFFVAPYLQTTLAGFYTELRDGAVNAGIISLGELGESTMQPPPEGGEPPQL